MDYKKEIKITGSLSTDQEDGHIYIEQGFTDFSIESRIEKELASNLPEYYNAQTDEWYSRIPKKEVEIIIRIK